MRRIIIGVLICMLVLSTGMGAFSSEIIPKKPTEPEPIDRDYSHTILGEFFTMTTCVPCKYSHQALKELYAEGYHPFYYITYVYNKNNNSRMRKNELNIIASPTTKFDGGYDTITGGESVEREKGRFNESILECAARTVNDIDISLNVEWLGAVNQYPEDGQTLVPIEDLLTWTVSEMKIDVEVKNNESSEYNGHLHIQITENESAWWLDKFGNPYTHEFKDYAYNGDVTLSAGETFSETIYWDGCDYNDADNPPRYFSHIKQDNILVIATVFDKDNNKYVDDVAGVHTGGFHAGKFTDPKTFDVYFGDINPPPKVISNGTAVKYNPPGDLNWSTTYYWKIDVWNAADEKTPGEVLEFTTRGNVAPVDPEPGYPKNNSEYVPTDTNLTWSCGDPNGDDVTYDVYFGKHDPFNPWKPELVANNVTIPEYDPTPYGTLEFITEYEWKIVAWDEYGLRTEGDVWKFKTEPNYPPNPAKDPRPPNGASDVPINAILYWNGSDPNSGDTLKYDVYFGLYEPPTQQTSNQSNAFYDPYGPTGDMQLFETYYWKIVTWDRLGEHKSTKVWSFTTGKNPRPTDPEIDGPTEGKVDVLYNFTFVSDDVNNDSIKYEIDWDGDNIVDETTELYPHAQPVTRSHSWPEKKTYKIRIRAIDEYDEPSEHWSEHQIKIPRSRSVAGNHNIFNWLFERYPNLFPLLRYLFGL